MTRSRLKGKPIGTRLLAHLPDSAFVGGKVALARKHGVVTSVIYNEMRIRGLMASDDINQSYNPSEKMRLRVARRRIYELHFVVGKSANEIARLMNFNAHDIAVLIGKMML